MSICINCQPFLSGNPDTRFTTSMGPSSSASKVARAVVCLLATPQSARYISYYFIIFHVIYYYCTSDLMKTKPLTLDIALRTRQTRQTHQTPDSPSIWFSLWGMMGGGLETSDIASLAFKAGLCCCMLLTTCLKHTLQPV
jgi:hypothetical protein